MKYKDLNSLLNGKDFHIDSLGRMVIEEEEILKIINGASSIGNLSEIFCDNTACANASC